jgi:hypothetical protein
MTLGQITLSLAAIRRFQWQQLQDFTPLPSHSKSHPPHPAQLAFAEKVAPVGVAVVRQCCSAIFSAIKKVKGVVVLSVRLRKMAAVLEAVQVH